MLYERIQRFVIGTLFSFLFSMCAIGELVTGFDLPLDSWTGLTVFCAVISVLFSCLLTFGLELVALAIPNLIMGIAGWRKDLLWKQLSSLFYLVSEHYSEVYEGWAVFGEPLTETYERALGLIALLVVMFIDICVCCGMSMLFTLPAIIVPIAACLVTTDTLPDERYLYFMLLGSIVLLLTNESRCNDPEGYPLSLLKTTPPTAAALALLFLLAPQESYVDHATAIFNEAMEIADSIRPSVNTGSSVTDLREVYDLADMGERDPKSSRVMRVRAPYDGVIYLRGRDYDVYNGTSWESTLGRAEMLTSGRSSVAEPIDIVTSVVEECMYIPYYASDSAGLIDGFVPNEEGKDSYSFFISEEPLRFSGYDLTGSEDIYTALPQETYEWARPLVKKLLADKEEDESAALVIGEYVRQSAAYDLKTASMNETEEGSTDFARWFLEESDTGYCVHFATASAVLLRAAEIPARYVGGYTVLCEAYKTVYVTAANAHAWVEYYDSTHGVWRILDSTPTAPEAAEEVPPEEVIERESDGSDETDVPRLPDEPDDTNEANDTASSDETSTDSTSTEEETDGTISDIAAVVKKLLSVLLIVSAFPIALILLRLYRRRMWNIEDPDRQAIERWRQTKGMARLMGCRLPGELERAALKASFSDRHVSAEELERFTAFRAYVKRTLPSVKWYRRLALHLLFDV